MLHLHKKKSSLFVLLHWGQSIRMDAWSKAIGFRGIWGDVEFRYVWDIRIGPFDFDGLVVVEFLAVEIFLII